MPKISTPHYDKLVPCLNNPSLLYFLVCEFLDMTPVSITSTQIDNVLILREVRKSRRIALTVR
jgi:hypothetical protein